MLVTLADHGQYFVERHTANVCRTTEKGERLEAGRPVERQLGRENFGGRMHCWELRKEEESG